MAVANLDAKYGFGKSQPKGANKYRGEILIAQFNNLTEASHAREVLMGFGYPEDSASMIELYHIAPNGGTAQAASQPTVNRVLKVGAILVGIIFITLASLLMEAVFGSAEIGVMLLVWIILTVGGTVICFFIGAMVVMLINSKAADWGLEAVAQAKIWINVELRTPIEKMLKESRSQRGKIWISVKLRTPGDARAIERKWREIVPKRSDLWIIQARD